MAKRETKSLQQIIADVSRDIKFTNDTSKEQKSMRRDLRKRWRDGNMTHDKNDRWTFNVSTVDASDYVFVVGVVRKHLTRSLSKVNASKATV